jgi:WD40 repeat protein
LLVTRDAGAYRSSTWAVPFSASKRQVTGPAFLLLDGASYASASSDGMLAAVEDAPPPLGQLIWKRSDGSVIEAVGEPLPGLAMPALSPDGERLAYVAIRDGNADLWVQDLSRGTRTRITSSDAYDGFPVWSTDGSRIYYSSSGGVTSLWILGVAADGSGAVDTLANGFACSASPDGKSLAYTVDRRGNADLWTVRLDRGKAAQPFLETPYDESAPSISPDGHWIAYASEESGRSEVYIRRYPEGDTRTQVSVRSGKWPRWSRRGDAIYYVQNDTLTVVPVGPGLHPVLGLPKPMFSLAAHGLELSASAFAGLPMDAGADGSRFITVNRTESPTSRSLLIVENWYEEFRKR